MTCTRCLINRIPRARAALAVTWLCLFLMHGAESASAQDQEFNLDQSDEWKNVDEVVPGSESYMLRNSLPFGV